MRAARAAHTYPDHPRSRGVYDSSAPPTATAAGSSPLARGLLVDDQAGQGAVGIIPARAGFTPAGRGAARGDADHPRSRGVYVPSGPVRATASGSSPLARGLPAHRDARVVHGRIIPARAGFTARGCGPRPVFRDHPRSRGVYNNLGLEVVNEIGSSPLARGLPAGAERPAGSPGIIPARAGFTRRTHYFPLFSPDHPRSRGVYRGKLTMTTVHAGSSPLARGLLGIGGTGARGSGIIPARAGFTWCSFRFLSVLWDHPRSRGVYSGLGGGRRGRWGSSPLARGLPMVPESAIFKDGIIPARAGFTRRPWGKT